MGSTEAMISSMKGVTKAMSTMNKSMNLPHMQKLMQQFQMADAQLEDKTEMMGDAIDDAVAEDGDSEEEAEIVGKVLDEIGIDFNGMVPNAPSGALDAASGTAAASSTKNPMAVGAGGDAAVDDLEARLNNLKK